MDISNWNVENVDNMGGLFYKGSFNGDITDWLAFRVQNVNSIFDNQEKFPYWAKIDDAQERKNAIDAYHTQKLLEQTIKNTHNNIHIIKI